MVRRGNSGTRRTDCATPLCPMRVAIMRRPVRWGRWIFQIDFGRIRAMGSGGRREAFEQFVCELAAGERPHPDVVFTCLHGAGGDGGVGWSASGHRARIGVVNCSSVTAARAELVPSLRSSASDQTVKKRGLQSRWVAKTFHPDFTTAGR